MILVYDGVRREAEEIEDALRAAGHEVRVLDTFLGAAALAREVKPDAVVFSVDRNSLVTACELRGALADLGVPLVVRGTTWHAYQLAVAGAWSGCDLVWPLSATHPAEEVRAVVERALAERKARDPAERHRRLARARRKRWGILIALLVAIAVAVVLDVRGPAFSPRLGNARWTDVALLLFWSALAVATARQAIAAARRGFRLPVAWLAFIAANVAMQIFFVVAR